MCFVKEVSVIVIFQADQHCGCESSEGDPRGHSLRGEGVVSQRPGASVCAHSGGAWPETWGVPAAGRSHRRPGGAQHALEEMREGCSL